MAAAIMNPAGNSREIAAREIVTVPFPTGQLAQSPRCVCAEAAKNDGAPRPCGFMLETALAPVLEPPATPHFFTPHPAASDSEHGTAAR